MIEYSISLEVNGIVMNDGKMENLKLSVEGKLDQAAVEAYVKLAKDVLAGFMAK